MKTNAIFPEFKDKFYKKENFDIDTLNVQVIPHQIL